MLHPCAGTCRLRLALLGHRVGDTIQVKLPRGVVDYELIGLRYGSGAP